MQRCSKKGGGGGAREIKIDREGYWKGAQVAQRSSGQVRVRVIERQMTRRQRKDYRSSRHFIHYFANSRCVQCCFDVAGGLMF